jgi:hypothetical protein
MAGLFATVLMFGGFLTFALIFLTLLNYDNESIKDLTRVVGIGVPILLCLIVMFGGCFS